eukprot:CAMPEP_0183374998 /NCGR_PEP_ID=MMETSP0164_2-20130417/116051_1 /TAXON_ID=221442 /ORGANISM="Coccolithus pelagicus ssp braarudi, Strain PLY182g" /LENGTH=42 /DNA_ID= /DNA_START= /DNA_END= /DNA_ORIENTATION=
MQAKSRSSKSTLIVAVQLVSQQWVINVLHVQPELVRSARNRP